MYPLDRLPDRTIILAWLQATPHRGVYHRMTTILWQIGYVEATEPKVRRLLKSALRKNRLLPRCPTPADYSRAYARAARMGGDELT